MLAQPEIPAISALMRGSLEPGALRPDSKPVDFGGQPPFNLQQGIGGIHLVDNDPKRVALASTNVELREAGIDTWTSTGAISCGSGWWRT
jgi:hypothetical protein